MLRESMSSSSFLLLLFSMSMYMITIIIKSQFCHHNQNNSDFHHTCAYADDYPHVHADGHNQHNNPAQISL